jgi:antitoxin (DNA-binding transcriptional repressor) of toxin-antitoxin stability system
MDKERMSIQGLKTRLSDAVAAAESRATILITRRNEPVARWGPAQPPDVHRGGRAGTGRLVLAIAKGTGGRAPAALLEDRSSR